MSSDPNNDSITDPMGSVTTHVYDAQGQFLYNLGDDLPPVATYDYCGVPAESAVPIHAESLPARTPGQPLLTRTFEFRLAGTETQEQCVPLASGLGPAGLLLTTTAVRAYLTRTADPVAAISAIGGVEVAAELGAGGIVCRASLSDFGSGDLVVVQVDVGLFDRAG